MGKKIPINNKPIKNIIDRTMAIILILLFDNLSSFLYNHLKKKKVIIVPNTTINGDRLSSIP